MFALSSQSPSPSLSIQVDDGQQRQSSSASRMILSKLRRLWPKFMELPESVVGGIGIHTTNSSTAIDPSCDISLIVPMYKERVTDIGCTLNRAFGNCRGDPKRIRVIVVHAHSSPIDGVSGDGSMLKQQLLLQHEQQRQQEHDPQTQQSESFWGSLDVVTIPFGEGGGRGGTLNVGSRHATAPILTFLHADTMVPPGWDEQIKGALLFEHGETTGSKDPSAKNGRRAFFPHACAFTMAIDDSNETNNIASSSPSSSSPFRQIPGLLGAEWLGVLRCHCGLPYGDSVLSFSRPMFDYMGGFPEQPLMEDYEVMDWLRLRSCLLSTMHKMTQNEPSKKNGRAEGLVLLRDRARCSPRRWQKYGTAYTSLVNATCVFRYRRKATAEDLFDFYYHCNSAAKTKEQKST
mmetsp:Transcript_15480/g.35443  ORF Transcript_15480/g.35443 Transcript_15480/m.35443 type:complete len:404 (-) Transcript_15480:770-1981(-)